MFVLELVSGLAPMNVAGLPINVQRRIALLLHQDTHEQTPSSTPFALPDPPLDQAAAATTRAEANHHDNIQLWNFPVHALAGQLRQQPAVVVNKAAFGPSTLQARYDKHALRLEIYSGVIAPLSSGLQIRGRTCTASCRARWPRRGLAALGRSAGTFCNILTPTNICNQGFVGLPP